MLQIQVTYEGDLHCSARHEPSGAVISTDAPVDNQGRGEAFSPTDLVATALATCMATIMGIYAKKHDLAIEGVTIVVEKGMGSDPRRIDHLAVNINVPINVDDRHRQGLETAADHCPVHNSIHPDIRVPVTFNFPG